MKREKKMYVIYIYIIYVCNIYILSKLIEYLTYARLFQANWTVNNQKDRVKYRRIVADEPGHHNEVIKGSQG